MKKHKFIGSILFIVCLNLIISGAIAGTSWFSNNDPKKLTDINDEPFTFSTFRKIAKEQSATVVNIATSKIIKREYHRQRQPWRSPFDDFFGDEFYRHFFPPSKQKVQSLGSGVIIDQDGYILTNYHVVKDVDEIHINTIDQKTYDAEIIGVDDQTDIALLKIETDDELTAIPFGDSDKLEVADWVMAIGNPFGFGHTVTVGVVSAKGRSMVMPYDELPYQDFIQTDASINPGNSGGPLLDVHGELVGINAVIASRTGQSAGIGFSIPINMILPLVNQLKESGTITRGWLGITIQSLNQELAETLNLDSKDGALVAEVIEDAPADKAGIKIQDVIIELDGKKILNSNQLTKIVANTPINKPVKITLIRNGKTKVLTVNLGERPKDLTEVRTTSGEIIDLGLTIQNLTPEIADQFRLKNTDGVLITEVIPGKAADHAGLHPGDVILEFNQKKIKSVEEYKNEVSKLQPGSSAVVYIKRSNSKIFIAIKIPKK